MRNDSLYINERKNMAICDKCENFHIAGNESYCDEFNEYCPEITEGGIEITECDLFKGYKEINCNIEFFDYCPKCGKRLK